jgi:hypothetical protein
MSGTFATGVAKKVAIALEEVFGTSPVTGGVYLRRTSSDLVLNIDSYQSQEILPSQQIEDARHGVRRPAGTFSGQMSPGSFDAFWQGLLRGTFATGSILSTVDLTLNVIAGTLTLVGGGLLAAGLLREDVVQISGAIAPNTALNGVNLRINGLSDTVITTRDLPEGLTLGALVGLTVTVVGKKLIMPTSGQIYASYAIEHWFSDIEVSELFTGCRIGQTTIQLPATGLVTFTSQMMGQNMTSGVSQQLTDPTGPTTTSALAAVNGSMSYNNVDEVIITGATISIAPAMEAPPVIGSNVVPWIFLGTMIVTGSFTALFENQVIADTFYNEIEVGISIMLTMGDETDDFMRFTLPRVKLMGQQKSDGQMSLVQSFTYTALLNLADDTIDMTTLVIQDSAA